MKKIVIPTILTATILIAGMFAFMPVEKASTVHTTILANTMQVRSFNADAGGLDLDDNDDIIVDCDVPFAVVGLQISGEDATVGADDDLEIDGIDLENGTNDINIVDNDAGITVTATAAGLLDGGFAGIDYIGEMTNAELNPTVGVVSDGRAVEFTILGTNLDAGAEFDVTALVYTTNSAACTVTGGAAGD